MQRKLVINMHSENADPSNKDHVLFGRMEIASDGTWQAEGICIGGWDTFAHGKVTVQNDLWKMVQEAMASCDGNVTETEDMCPSNPVS